MARNCVFLVLLVCFWIAGVIEGENCSWKDPSDHYAVKYKYCTDDCCGSSYDGDCCDTADTADTSGNSEVPIGGIMFGVGLLILSILTLIVCIDRCMRKPDASSGIVIRRRYGQRTTVVTSDSPFPTGRNPTQVYSIGPPSYRQGQPASTQGPPSYRQGQPASTQGPASYTQGQPASTQGPASYTQGQPASTQGPTAYRQGQPASTQGPPSYRQGKPASTQGQPSYTQGQPVSTQGPPSYTQGQPASTQGPPAYSLYDHLQTYPSNISEQPPPYQW